MARALEDAGIESKQAEAIVWAIGSSGEATATKADLETATAQLAIAGLLFAALRVFG